MSGENSFEVLDDAHHCQACAPNHPDLYRARLLEELQNLPPEYQLMVGDRVINHGSRLPRAIEAAIRRHRVVAARARQERREAIEEIRQSERMRLRAEAERLIQEQSPQAEAAAQPCGSPVGAAFSQQPLIPPTTSHSDTLGATVRQHHAFLSRGDPGCGNIGPRTSPSSTNIQRSFVDPANTDNVLKGIPNHTHNFQFLYGDNSTKDDDTIIRRGRITCRGHFMDKVSR